MAPQRKSEMSVKGVVHDSNMPFQTKRRESLKTVSSWGNPWNEPLPMAPISQRRSLPDHLVDSDETANHSKRNQARTSCPTVQPPSSVFPSMKRTGWLSFFTASFRPSIHNRQHLLSFESLTKIRCFGEILIRLSDDSVNKAQWLKCRGDESPLHLLLQYRPPLTVVNTVIFELKQLGQKCPEAICDAKGRNSLHIACATVPSNSVAVIARLLNGQTISNTGNPAAVADKQKMLPLHHACNGKLTKGDLESRVLIIRFLAECYPQGVLLLNNRGLTPSDLARKNCNNPEIHMILYQTIVDQRVAATANAINNKSIDMFSNNILNNDLVQKYTKSEHRRDGLAAFVQSSSPLTNVPKNRLTYNIEKDDISDFASMDTFGRMDTESVETANDATGSRSDHLSHNATGKSSTPMSGKNQVDITGSDEGSEIDSVYTFGFIADDYSAIANETSGNFVQEAENHIPTKMPQRLEPNSDIVAQEDTSTEPSENHNSVIEHLLCPYESEQSGNDDSKLFHDMMEYSNSETDQDEHVTESNAATTYSLSKYLDTQNVQPLLSEMDTSSVSLNSLTVDSPSTSDSDGTPIISPTAKKFVQFNDRVQICILKALPFDSDYDDDDDDNYPSKDVMDHTDPTESETSTSSSSNPFDDSDRGSSRSVTRISEITTATTTSSLMMQRYGHDNMVTPVHTTNKIQNDEIVDAVSLYFL